MRRLVDWTLEDNMVDGLLFCATLTSRRGGQSPFVRAGAETSDIGAEAVKPDPGSSWEGHSGGCLPMSRMKVRSLVGLSTHSTFYRRSAQCAARMLFLPDRLMGCCAAGTNGCLDLRCHASAIGGEVSAKWRGCRGSMAWRARDSVAPLRSTLRLNGPGLGWLSAELSLQHPKRIKQAASGARRMMSASCEVTQGVGDEWATGPTLL